MRRSMISMYLNGKLRLLLFWSFVICAVISFPSMIIKMSMINVDTSPRAASYWNVVGGSNFGTAGGEGIELFNDTTKSDEAPFRWCPLPDKAANASPAAGGGGIKTEPLVDCDSLFAAANDDVVREAASWTPPCSYNEQEMADIACDCDTLKQYFYFEPNPLSDEELRFPLAFILVVEKHAEQVVRLLARMYQPQNLYCLTYDEHSSSDFKRSMTCLSKCLHNIVMPVRHFPIYWADISILDATTTCMKKMVSMQPQHQWRYVQILSWNDLPLRTNVEMVRIFKMMNGSCDSELTHGQPERYRKVHYHGGLDHSKFGVRRPVPPDGLTMYKGSYAVSLPRDFCEFLLRDPVAQRLYTYSRRVWAPEEQFWSTLVHNPNLNHSSYFPGTCLHYYDMEANGKAWISRYQVWSNNCAGKMVSGSCCFGVGDLDELVKKTSLVAHKFYADFQPATWYCMLKWHHDRTYNATIAGKFPLNVAYYETLPAVRYQRLKNKDEFTC